MIYLSWKPYQHKRPIYHKVRMRSQELPFIQNFKELHFTLFWGKTQRFKILNLNERETKVFDVTNKLHCKKWLSWKINSTGLNHLGLYSHIHAHPESFRSENPALATLNKKLNPIHVIRTFVTGPDTRFLTHFVIIVFVNILSDV